MDTNKTVLVLGATGGVGSAIAGALGRRGWTVRALVRDAAKAAASWTGSRSPEWISGDAMSCADVVAAADGVSVLVHAVNPQGYRHWDRLVLPMMANTIVAARAAGARIVLPGTIYNFDPSTTPIVDADTPQLPRTRKGGVRVRMEQMLEHAAPGVPSLIVRAGDFFGPGARSSWLSQGMVKPGMPVRQLLRMTRRGGHSWAYLPDLAEAFGQLIDTADRLASFERVQFAGHYDASGTGMTEAIRRAVGRNVAEKDFPWPLMRLLAPFGGFPREVIEIRQYWQHPLRLDNRRLVALIGEEPHTPLDAAVAQTLADLNCLDQPAADLAAQAA